MCPGPPWEPLGWGRAYLDHLSLHSLRYLEQLPPATPYDRARIPVPTFCLSQFLRCVLQEAGDSEGRD